ncbi:Retrovirus-related Pol polyprotein from transposon RE1 (Retro element 1) (AtRE1) [Includes: Protease RE1 [Durusdinium trenchii]|uniref:Retrovirus-related Pol polyprotein from transposon RE1 (Retro element 1) (AtRE1) n=1 Tax=Durusdinium trenchii TaxID=1381693 RepID=A0ABP0NTI7_9DINO
MNQIINQDAWRRSLRIAEPIAKLCGEIALIQLSGNRHYLVEQPTGSTLFKVVPWPTVVRDRRSLSIAFDQCQVGQSAGGYPAKKSTELVASSQELLKPFVGRTCPGIHQRQVLTGRAASQAQKWPREMCQMIAFGIEQLVRAELRKMKKEQAYPTVASDTSDPKGDSAVEESPWRKCKGCLWRLQKFDSRHSRVPGECKHPDLEAIEFKCPGCMKGLPRSNELHDYGPDCRHALTTRRTGTRRRPFSRVPAEEEPTSKLKASELGKADEASAAAADAAEPASSSAAAAGQPSALPDEHDKTTSQILQGFDQWLSTFGPPQVLIFDGEQGLKDDEARMYFEIKGITKREAIVEGTARERMKRALHTPTSVSGEELELKVGEAVECLAYWASPSIINKNSNHAQQIAQEAIDQFKKGLAGSEWVNTRFIQCLQAPDTEEWLIGSHRGHADVAAMDVDTNDSTSNTTPRSMSVGGPLSTIPEGSNEGGSEDALVSFQELNQVFGAQASHPAIQELAEAFVCFNEHKDTQELPDLEASKTNLASLQAAAEADVPEWYEVEAETQKSFLAEEAFADSLQDALRDSNPSIDEDERGSYVALEAYGNMCKVIEGFENFNPATEVLRCTKPGTGCRDAPRAWSMKLRKATAKYGLKSTLMDSELEYLLDSNGKICLLLLKHVEDLKIAGPKKHVLELVEYLSFAFGKLGLEFENFTFCGIRHQQTAEAIALDQTSFIAAIKEMTVTPVSMKEEYLSEDVRRQFLSLLMTVAYALLTRLDIAVYVTALQRVSHIAQPIHVKRLNHLVRWMKQNPRKLVYRKMEYPTSFVVYSDSELFASTDAVDATTLTRLALHELRQNSLSESEAHNILTGDTRSPIDLHIVLDAMSVTSAIVAPTLKVPAENSLVVHLRWYRQQLQRGILKLAWADTRDMIADGMTKGSVSREALEKAMEGFIACHRQFKAQQLA